MKRGHFRDSVAIKGRYAFAHESETLEDVVANLADLANADPSPRTLRMLTFIGR